MNNQYKTDLIITSRLLLKLFKIKPKVVFRYFHLIQKIRDKSGLQYCIKYMKTSRLHITRYISGKPLLSNADGVGLENRFPKKLYFLKELIDQKDPLIIRGVLTLLSYTRAIIPTKKEESKIELNFNSIIKDYKGKNYSIPMYFIKDFVKRTRSRRSKPTFDNGLHYISGKSSPFGKATASGPYALFCMCHIHHDMLSKFIQLIGQDSYMVTFGNFIKTLWKRQYLMIVTNFTAHLGKLSIVKDPELKRRVIAMLDYNSQILLRPIHEIFLNLLRNMPQDRTFTQDPHNIWKPSGNNFWSLDLSSATDRFPIALQEKLVSAVFDDRDFAKSWKEILVNRKFSYEENVYEYSVGQPMGAYSSWAVFALSHHLVVAWAAHLCGLINFTDYILLGDDIVINNNDVAIKYRTIMTRLGVDISVHKTHVSRNTYEFAKRWIQRGVEISPLPLKGILHNKRNLHVVFLQLYNYLKKVNTNYRGSCLELISEIMSNVDLSKVKLNDKVKTLSKKGEVLTNSTIITLKFSKIKNNISKIIKEIIKLKIINKSLKKSLMITIKSLKIYKSPTLYTKRFYFKPASVFKHCYDFNMVIRYAYNDATNIELHEYFCSKVNGDFPIPNEKLIPSFTRELLTLGLSDQAETAGDEIKGYFNSFFNKFKDGHDFKPEYLKSHPLLHACYNRIEEIWKDLYRIKADKNFNLIESMQCMRVDKVDEIVALKRDTKKTVRSLDVLWRKSLRMLNKINTKNYNSYEISGFSYGYDMQPWQSYYLSNLTKIKDEMDNLRDGIYNDPNKPLLSGSDIADFWSSRIFQ
jgi:hypothetical protein